MKRFLTAVAIFLFLMGILAYAQFGFSTAAQNDRATTPTGVKTEAANDAETEIREILQKYYKIARDGDRESLKNFSREITSPEYRYTSENGVLDKSAALSLLDAKPEILAADFSDFSVQSYGETAVVKYKDVSKTRSDGILKLDSTRFTNVWIKRDGKWLIAAEHSNRQPASEFLPPNPLMENLAKNSE